MQTPSVGRIVHYVSTGSADGRFPSVCRAAIVTEIPSINGANTDQEYLNLSVLNPTGVHFAGNVQYAEPVEGEALKPYTWHWPERVD